MNITWTTKHVTYLLQQTDCMAITSTCLLHMHAALHTITRHCACTNNNTHVYDRRQCACARAHAHTKRMRGRGYQACYSPPPSSLANYHYGDAIASSPAPGQSPNPNPPQERRLYPERYPDAPFTLESLCGKTENSYSRSGHTKRQSNCAQ